MNQSRLTDEAYWNNQYKVKNIGNVYRINTKTNLAVQELDNLFKRYLPVDERLSFLEVGCAPGIWMEYFHKNFHYSVDGIEYTSSGYRATIRNLAKFKVEGKVYHQDFFEHSLGVDRYDVVFSGGFIEHFSEAEDVIKRHIDLLKPQGIAVIEIPNLGGLLS